MSIGPGARGAFFFPGFSGPEEPLQGGHRAVGGGGEQIAVDAALLLLVQIQLLVELLVRGKGLLFGPDQPPQARLGVDQTCLLYTSSYRV